MDVLYCINSENAPEFLPVRIFLSVETWIYSSLNRDVGKIRQERSKAFVRQDIVRRAVRDKLSLYKPVKSGWHRSKPDPDHG